MIRFQSSIILLVYLWLSAANAGSLVSKGKDGSRGITCEAYGESQKLSKSKKDTTQEKAIAAKLETALNMVATDIAIVGRVGSDLSDRKFKDPSKLKYTHAGFAVKGPKGWYFDHLLNICLGPKSALYQQTLEEFYLDSPHSFDTVIIVPTNNLQIEIAQVLETELRVSLHDPAYNKIAYPFSIKYQNSNQWILEIVGAAIMGIDTINLSRSKIQDYLKVTGFQPTRAYPSVIEHIGIETGLGLGENTKTDDQPRPHKPLFVSVDSIEAYLSKNSFLKETLHICPQSKIGDECK